MHTKSALISHIIQELRKTQSDEWKNSPKNPVRRVSFPPRLWLGDGRSFGVTEDLLRAILAFTRIYWDNSPTLKPRFKINELNKLTEHAFANALVELNLDLNDEQLHQIVSERVAELLHEQIERHDRPVVLTLGCHLIEGDEAFPIEIGPVLFETRECWRNRMLTTGKLSTVTARRLHAHWNGKALRKRKRSFDEDAERSILNAIGNCPVVCSVATEGLSGKYIQEKGLLAARLAISAISLTWHQPSQGLRWMNLLYDRRLPHRHTVLFGAGTNVGAHSECTELPMGRHVEPELIENLRDKNWLFDQIGEALRGYVQPNKIIAQPNFMDALFLSLWWYNEACRETQDQIATTKFAASMDVLAGGKGDSEIVRLIGAQLGPKPDDALMRDGRTTKQVISQIYCKGRSKLIHGSSDNFSHDWTQLRASAEAIGRLLIILCSRWISENKESDCVAHLRERSRDIR